jgi:hypothetical protein
VTARRRAHPFALARSGRVAGSFALAAWLGASCGDVTSDLIVRDVEKVTSCLSATDCPSEQSRCDVPSGRCRECLERSHCAAGQSCSLPAGTCVQGCDGGAPCSGAQPVCDGTSGLCRGCAADGECSEAASHCQLETGRCVACFTNADCAGDERLCDPSGRCVECLTDGHCEEEIERCSSVLGECSVPCTSNAGCESDDPVCDLAVGFCVECKEDRDCGPDEVCRSSDCERLPPLAP